MLVLEKYYYPKKTTTFVHQMKNQRHEHQIWDWLAALGGMLMHTTAKREHQIIGLQSRARKEMLENSRFKIQSHRIR